MSESIFKHRSVRNVNWTVIPKVNGRIIERGEHDIDGEAREYVVLDDGAALFRVYRAADLTDAFKVAAIGDQMSVEFVESVTLKKSGRRLNRFVSAVWTVPKSE